MESTRQARQRRKSRASAAFLLLLMGCSSVDAPFDPRAEPFSPPLVYERWWAMTESCSGLTASFRDIDWYTVPGSDIVLDAGKQAGGYWAPISNSILLAGNAILNGGLVRHEMLHALVRKRSGHLRSYFLERCGGVVSCSDACIADAGPPPAVEASVPRVTPDSLQLGVALVPGAPSSAVDGGVFTIVVTATNTQTHPVVVTLDPLGLGKGFFFGIFGQVKGIIDRASPVDLGVTFFRAGETKRQYFDFVIDSTFSDRRVISGIYKIDGGYSSRYATIENVVIGP